MTHAAVEPDDRSADPLIDRAVRLFQFLTRAQQLKNQPTRSLETYDSVVWLGALPTHPAIRVITERPSPDDAVLTLDRVSKIEPPQPAADLASRLVGRCDNPAQPPQLDQSSATESTDWEPLRVDPDDPAYARYMEAWEAWAARERLDRPVRDLYAELFSIHSVATGNPEQLELVAGIGCLTWNPPEHGPVRRHAFTAPLVTVFDDNTGRLTVGRGESIDALTLELDMLDPSLTTSDHLDNIRTEAARLEMHPLDREHVGALTRRLVNSLDPDGSYAPDDTPPTATSRATAAFAPAIILRKRSQLGLVQIFSTIQRQIAETGHIPAGVIPLIDPDYRPPVESDHLDGALVTVDDDVFLPLPVNDVQLRILKHVDQHAQTLVQGPPGTGKTHTAAALLSHLLAQGKRVLVTAHTDRALQEVRAKLPSAIRPLSVAVVGSSREEMADLKISIEHIVSVAHEHDADAAQETIRTCLANIEELRNKRAALYRDLREGRENELREFQHAGYRGTLAAIAQQHYRELDTYAWLADLVVVPQDAPAPLDNGEIAEWHRYLTDTALAADLAPAHERLIDLAAITPPEEFAALLARLDALAAESGRLAHLTAHPAYAAMHRLPTEQRTELRRRLDDLANSADDLARRREVWMNEALADVCSGRAGIWQSRARQIGDLIGHAEKPVNWLDPRCEVRVTGGDLGVLVNMALQVRPHLADGAKIKTEADGTPKMGALTAKPIKVAQPLFASVRVNGLPPTTPAQIDMFRAWADAMITLSALDRAWPDSVQIRADDTLHERLQWHRTECQQLYRVLELGSRLETEGQWLARAGLPRPDWNDLASVRQYADVMDAVGAHDALSAAQAPLRRLDDALTAEAQWSESGQSVRDLLAATRGREPNAYRSAFERLRWLWEVRRLEARRDELGAVLARTAANLHASIEQSPSDPLWSQRLPLFAEAWAWASTGAWLRDRISSDVNPLQAEVTRTEERIRKEVETLAATRAWGWAVSEERLTGRSRNNLTQYAQLVRALGKGMGKYADQRRADIRQALDRCRPSVPVWIMPIYRIAEQFQVEPDMFDVVVVDEASQAGLEATFLQYLAPKMIVIGDDRQVSPSAVGVDQQQMRDLAAQYLPRDDRATWSNPMRSLFDEAKARYQGMLTLTEHRRCVPEIIGFSNRIGYEPEGIRLVPVRQYGADRLEPIKPVFLPNGLTRGTAKVNQVEVDAIVDQIEKCIADPRYDGLTFGVISLLGKAQAKAIERALLDRVPASEWQARALRCGDSTDFQGSERDVMFLSMVAAPEPDARIMPLTQTSYVQRFNVAASRAKDQMWVFHSVDLADLHNPEDMRFALLDYCYGVTRHTDAADDSGWTTSVSEDRSIEPFESLFEQRVFNRLIDLGYRVIPQHATDHYRIDLVVVGAKARLAVECDGDTWRGADAYERDLANQRDLERCGWEFFRIRETEFYVDQERVFRQLGEVLDELDIHPSGWVPSMSRTTPTPGQTIDAAPDEITVATDVRDSLLAVEPVEPVEPVDIDDALEAGFERYQSFLGQLAPPHHASMAQRMDGIVAVLDTEGPMLGHCLYLAYVRATGGKRTSPVTIEVLAAALKKAVTQGLVAVDNPLGDTPTRLRTYRLPTQPVVRVRTLGPRSLDEVPPAELAAMMDKVANGLGWDNEETLFRATLDLLNLRRLTTNAVERMTQVLPLTRRDEPPLTVTVAAVASGEEDDQPASTPIEDWAAATNQSDLVDELLASETLTDQQSRMARPMALETIRAVVTGLLAARGVMPLDALARAAGEAPSSAYGFAQTLRRLLNVDGAPVLSIVDDGARARLDEALLREQFDLRAGL